MASPILKVATSSPFTGKASTYAGGSQAATPGSVPPSIQHSLRAFGIVVSSTAPGYLFQVGHARRSIRHAVGLR